MVPASFLGFSASMKKRTSALSNSLNRAHTPRCTPTHSRDTRISGISPEIPNSESSASRTTASTAAAATCLQSRP